MNQINQTLNLFAPAKLNLNLKVLNKDKDNFHFINSHICFLKLCDFIELKTYNRTLIVQDKKNSHFLLKKETILNKTLTLFKNHFNWKKDFKVTLIKKIPVGAGLGGGSADSASLLLGLRKLYNQQHSYKIKIKDLLQIGTRIGSDVPACIYSRSLIASGKGEKISICKTPNHKKLLIIFPNIRLSTKTIFQNFDLKNYKNKHVNFLKNIEINNSLLQTACYIEPKIEKVLSLLKSLDNIKNYGMTGSGSAFFAIFENLSDLKIALTTIKFKCDNNWYIWYGEKKEFGFNRFLY